LNSNQTGAYAFRLKEKKVLTSLKVAELIKAVEILWFHEFGTRQKFAVEPITEGGLLFKDIEGYKSFRLMITGWPGIYPNVDYYEKWSNPTEPVLDFKQPISDYPYHFFIKAREGAPLWTRREVEVFAVAFTQIEFKVIKTSLQGICVRWFKSGVEWRMRARCWFARGQFWIGRRGNGLFEMECVEGIWRCGLGCGRIWSRSNDQKLSGTDLVDKRRARETRYQNTDKEISINYQCSTATM
jgi:hypothetical protein